MSTSGATGAEQKNRAKRQLAEQARRLAVEGKWLEALSVNQELIERSPRDVEAYNRVGKANFELKRYASAYAAYEEANRLDPANAIARRNIQRLEGLKDVEEETEVGEGQPIRYGIFVEEVGKTYVDDLVNVANPADLVEVSSGDPLTLTVDGDTVELSTLTGQYVGQLEPRIGRRVAEMCGLGNVYEAYVTSSLYAPTRGEYGVRVIIREVSRSDTMGDRLSFPRQGKVAIPRAYLRDTRLFRGEEPELMLGEDEDDEVEGEDAEEFDATDIEDEAEYTEDAGSPTSDDEDEDEAI